MCLHATYSLDAMAIQTQDQPTHLHRGATWYDHLIGQTFHRRPLKGRHCIKISRTMHSSVVNSDFTLSLQITRSFFSFLHAVTHNRIPFAVICINYHLLSPALVSQIPFTLLTSSTSFFFHCTTILQCSFADYCRVLLNSKCICLSRLSDDLETPAINILKFRHV
jgi:hypothetical protein